LVHLAERSVPHGWRCQIYTQIPTCQEVALKECMWDTHSPRRAKPSYSSSSPTSSLLSESTIDSPSSAVLVSQTGAELSSTRLLSVVDDDDSVREATGRFMRSLDFT